MFWFGAIVSLCYVPGITGAYIATQWPVLSLLLPFALLRRGPFTWMHVLGLLFILCAAVHIPFSPIPRTAVFGFWLIAIMGLSVWFGTTMASLRDVYAGLATGAAVSSAVAVLQYFGFDLIPTTSATFAGLYVNSVQQGTVLALIIVALVSERMWLWVFPLVPGLALSGSRGAWLALTIGLLGNRLRHPLVFCPVLLAGAFYLLSPLSNSDQVRVFIWRFTWQALTWLGYGPGMFYMVALERNGALFFPEHVHNDALQLAFEYGIAAVLPLGIFAFVLRCTDAKEWSIVLAFVVAGCYSMPLWMPVASFLALAAVGRILRTHALACRDGIYSRLDGVPRRRDNETESNGAVSVAPNN